MKLKHAVCAGVAGALLSAYAYSMQLPKDIITDAKAEKAVAAIKAGELSYSRQCGWVDWGHARGDGPKDLVERVMTQTPGQLSDADYDTVVQYMKEHRISSKDYYPVAYYQQMKKQGLQVGTRSVYLVKKDLAKRTREGVAWRIFKEVSDHFEDMQGSGPFGLVPSTAASSYGIGDLTGDKISFYKALREYSQRDIEHICKPYTKEQSLRKLERQRHDPKGQGKWKKIPQLLSVPHIPRGIVKTVIKDKQFVGSYP